METVHTAVLIQSDNDDNSLDQDLEDEAGDNQTIHLKRLDNLTTLDLDSSTTTEQKVLEDTTCELPFWVHVLHIPLFHRLLLFSGFGRPGGWSIFALLAFWTVWQFILNIVIKFNSEKAFGSPVWVLLPAFGLASYWRMWVLVRRARRLNTEMKHGSKAAEFCTRIQPHFKRMTRASLVFVAFVVIGTFIKSMIAIGFWISDPDQVPYTSIERIPFWSVPIFFIHAMLEPFVLGVITIALIFPFLLFHSAKKWELFRLEKYINSLTKLIPSDLTTVTKVIRRHNNVRSNYRDFTTIIQPHIMMALFFGIFYGITTIIVTLTISTGNSTFDPVSPIVFYLLILFLTIVFLLLISQLNDGASRIKGSLWKNVGLLDASLENKISILENHAHHFPPQILIIGILFTKKRLISTTFILLDFLVAIVINRALNFL